MKTVLFVPGFQESLESRDYKSTIDAIKSRGYNVEFVPIQWKRTTVKNWQQELEKVYSKYDVNQTILAGFSFGAVTAFMAATKRNPSALWLFSFSPYFAEDQDSKYMKQVWIDEIGKRRIAAFSKLNFADLAQLIKCPTKIFIGDKEIENYPIMGERFDAAIKYIANIKKVIVVGAEHDVADPRYVKAIAKNV